jgi:DNA-binding transcriptional ArsR family regulator
VDNLSRTLTAISDPTRRAILERLSHGEATVNEIAAPFRMSQQAVSKHLAYLELAHLIEKRREGRKQVCRLNIDALTDAVAWAENCRAIWNVRFDRLEFVLESMKKETPQNGRK